MKHPGVRRLYPLVLFGALFLVSGRVEAHLVTTGLGPLYDGGGHLLLSPECWLAPFVLGLLAGLRGQAHGRCALIFMPVAWFVVGIACSFINAKSTFPASTMVLLALGLLTAANLAMSVRTVSIIAALTGAVQGLADGLSMPWREGGGHAVLGSAATAWIVLVLVSGFVVTLQAPWQKIVVRVIGSWIAATGLLMLGWWIKRS